MLFRVGNFDFINFDDCINVGIGSPRHENQDRNYVCQRLVLPQRRIPSFGSSNLDRCPLEMLLELPIPHREEKAHQWIYALE